MTDQQVTVVAIGATVLVVGIVIVQYVSHVRFMRKLRATAAELLAQQARHRPPTDHGGIADGGVDPSDRGGDA